MRKYRDLSAIEKSKVGDVATHRNQKWKLASLASVAPLTLLGHPDCRRLVRKRTGAPRHTLKLSCVQLGFS